MDVAEDSGIIKLVSLITSTFVFIGGAYTCAKISFAVPTIHGLKKKTWRCSEKSGKISVSWPYFLCNYGTYNIKKQVGMIGKYYNHIPQTNQRHREEEPQNSDCHKTSGRQLEQSNQLSLPHQYDCKTRRTKITGALR